MKIFKKDNRKEALRKELIDELADYLMAKGFSVEESYKMGEQFWKTNWKKVEEKLKEVV
jgi:hypothetical protein